MIADKIFAFYISLRKQKLREKPLYCGNNSLRLKGLCYCSGYCQSQKGRKKRPFQNLFCHFLSFLPSCGVVMHHNWKNFFYKLCNICFLQNFIFFAYNIKHKKTPKQKTIKQRMMPPTCFSCYFTVGLANDKGR